jgi:hypothetical protein
MHCPERGIPTACAAVEKWGAFSRHLQGCDSSAEGHRARHLWALVESQGVHQTAQDIPPLRVTPFTRV